MRFIAAQADVIEERSIPDDHAIALICSFVVTIPDWKPRPERMPFRLVRLRR
jgi:hypothetical protein